MNNWQKFLDSFNSAGGHIIVLVSLLVLGTYIGSMELQVASMGALFAYLRTNPER
jgi:hypothetical protein